MPETVLDSFTLAALFFGKLTLIFFISDPKRNRVFRACSIFQEVTSDQI